MKNVFVFDVQIFVRIFDYFVKKVIVKVIAFTKLVKKTKYKCSKLLRVIVTKIIQSEICESTDPFEIIFSDSSCKIMEQYGPILSKIDFCGLHALSNQDE